jgi:hypothetical protein
MNVYHVPVSREDRREWWDPMMSSKVTWTLLNVPRATVVKGDNCAVGPENKVNQNFGSRGWKGKRVWKSQEPKTRNPKSRSPEVFGDGRTVADFKGDSCVVGPESKETEFLEFGNFKESLQREFLVMKSRKDLDR